MDKQAALQDLNAQWAAGDIDAHAYAVERYAIEYAEEQAQSAWDDEREVAS